MNDLLLSLLNANAGQWQQVASNASGKRVLIATSMAIYDHAAILERLLAVSLVFRGAEVEFLLCDNALPACQMTKLHGCDPEKLLSMDTTPRCTECVDLARRLFDPLGLPVHRFSQFLVDGDYEVADDVSRTTPADKIRDYVLEGAAIGEHAYAGALRYYGRGDLQGEPHGEDVLRRFFRSSLLTAAALKSLYRMKTFDVALFHHGIYVPQGVIGEVTRKQRIRVVNWNASYRKNTFIFSHNDTYHHTMIDEPTSVWDKLELDAAMERKLDDYLFSRRDGSSDWIWFHEHPASNADELGKELGIDWSKPCIGMLTSVMWDAQLHYKANAFPSMLNWVLHTIEYFRRRPDLQLILRIHPAEVRGMVPSRQKIADEIVRLIPDLPSNVAIVRPEHQASTYALMDRCNSVIIFNTKTGIELSAAGVPVIVAGEAWIRSKGFSWDAENPVDYDLLLDRLPKKQQLSSEHKMRAKRYAYHFFFRRMIDVPFIESPEKYKFELSISNLNDLKAGECRGLDVICNGILNGEPFIQ